jgi:tetratricopeptide (TPR) repeat protein
MTAELVLSVLAGSGDGRGYVAGFAVTDERIVAVGGTSTRSPMVITSADGRRFEPRAAPRNLGLRDVLAVGDSLWVCGERGQLAVSRDHGARWEQRATGTEACLFALALGGDGAIWVVGDAGYAARVLGEVPRRIELGTTARLASVHAVRDEIVVLGGDGTLVRWRDGRATAVACGATRPLTALAVTSKGTWVVIGDGGFVARSPDGTWYSRVDAGGDADLEAISALPDGTLVIAGDRGRLLRSTDDARSWGGIAHDLGIVHLWSIERFGGGALIGGDDGLIAKLAPADDATWRERSADGSAPEAVAEAAEAAAGAPEAAAGAPEAAAGAPEAAVGAPEIAVDAPEAAVGAPEIAVDAAEAAVGAPEIAVDAAEAAVGAPEIAVDAPEAVLEATPPARWTDLAWQWLDDGSAHRALLARLAQADPVQRAQIVAINELGDLTGDARVIALPRLAAELSSELEALLVGSLVRGDDLQGVLRASLTGGVDGDEDAAADADAEQAQRSPGWAAIDRALAPIYGAAEPLHYGTVLPYSLGGNDPIHGISVYARDEPRPHWHFVTYGFTDLFSKETDDPDESGYGFELTFRLAHGAEEVAPPSWALNFLQNLGRYVFSTGNAFAAGHKMGLNGPIALDHATEITAICFADDPELGELSSEFGNARFVQIVGITDDEYRLIQEWSTTGLVEILTQRLPLLVTDLDRGSVLADPATAAVVRERVDREGSSEDLTFAGELAFDLREDQIRIELGALYAVTLPRAMRGRIRHGRHYELRGRHATLRLEPSETPGYRHEDNELVLEITAELASELEVVLRDGLAGTYPFAAWDRLTIVVTPSLIRGQDGNATEVRGIADPDEAARVVAEENARLAAAGDDADAEDVAEDAEDVEDAADADDAEDDAVLDPVRVAAALAMTSRARRLAPDDEDVQFTHGMLLLDAERAGDLAKADELLAALPAFAPGVRINLAVRMARSDHRRFGDAVELVLAEALPERIFGGDISSDSGASIVSIGDIADELFEELGHAILARAPHHFAALVPLLPDDAKLLSELAPIAIEAGQRDAALAIYDRMLAITIPDDGDERMTYLRALNNACVQAHAARAFDAAVRIADRAQPVARENPYLYHAAACAYAAVHDYTRALEQVKLAIEHDYDHVAKIETDADLGALLERPELQALFRDWHARQEGN